MIQTLVELLLTGGPQNAPAASEALRVIGWPPNMRKVGFGSEVRIRDGSDSGLVTVAEPTLSPERRQCGGSRPFKRSGLNSRFVP